MQKKNIYIPLRAVPFIFVSITAIIIVATTNIIIQYLIELYPYDLENGSIEQTNSSHQLMKIFRIAFTVISLSMVFFLLLKLYRNFNISRDLRNEEKNKLKKSAEVLNECFDLKNKSQRTLNESIKLIEYCLKEYGSEK